VFFQTKKKDSDRKNYVINEIMTCSVREKILARAFKIQTCSEKPAVEIFCFF